MSTLDIENIDDFIIESEVTVRTLEYVVEPRRKPPPVCRCKYTGCAKLTAEAEETLKKNSKDILDRDTYLMRLLKVGAIKRPRDRKESDKSRRSKSITYNVPCVDSEEITDGNRNSFFFKVCKVTFMRVFDISEKKLRLLVSKRRQGEMTAVDKRKDNGRKKKYSESDVILIKRHIDKFPRVTSHYGAIKSPGEFLSPDLNFSRMYRKFKEEYPDTAISRKFYIETFKKLYPKLKFKQLRVDTCRTCDILNIHIQAGNKDSPKSQVELKAHHDAVNQARKECALESKAAILPQTLYSVATIDLQQVYSIPKLTHSDVCYSKQLSVYNFGIHLEDNNTGFMYVWNESRASRGSNEIASCLFHFLTRSDFVYRKEVRLWADNCTGQNKNKTIIFMLLWCVFSGFYHEIHLSFLVSGHTFLSSDRDFGILGNRKKRVMLFTPNDVRKMIAETREKGSFIVTNMDQDNMFFNFHELADKYLNTTALKITDVKSIRIVKDYLFHVYVKYDFDAAWSKKKIFKRNVQYKDAFSQLNLLPTFRSLDKKLADIKKLMPYVPAKKRGFYQKLVLQETRRAEDRVIAG